MEVSEDNTEFDRRCEGLLESGRIRALQTTVLDEAKHLVDAGEQERLLYWLSELLAITDEANPWLDYWQGYCLRFSCPETAWPMLESAYEQFNNQGDVTGQYAAWLALVEAMALAFDDLKPLQRWLLEYEALRARHPRCPELVLRFKTLALAGSVMSVVDPLNPRLKRLIRVCEAGVRLIPLKAPRQAMLAYLTFHYASTGRIARLHTLARHLLPALDDTALPGPIRLLAHSMVGLHLLMGGDPGAEKRLDEAVDLSMRLEDSTFRSTPRAYRLYCDAMAGRMVQARTGLEAFFALIRQGHRMDVSHHDFIAAWLSALQGNPVQALEESELSKSLSRHLGFDFGVALNASLRAQLFSTTADFAAADAELAELDESAKNSGSHLLRVMHGFASAWRRHCSGEAEICLRQLRDSMALAEDEGILAYPGFHRSVMSELVKVAAEAGLHTGYSAKLVRRWQLIPESLNPLDMAWPWPVRITTLGRLEVATDTGREALQGRPLELLQAILAMGGRDVPKSTLCDALWPAAEADKAQHALDNLIHRLRRQLGQEAITMQAGRVGLDDSRCWVDFWALDALYTDQRSAEPMPPGEAAVILSRIYAGDFLPADDSGHALSLRERLRSRFVLTTNHIGQGLKDAAVALEHWEHALAVEPASEQLYESAMQYHIDQGHPVEALRVYHRCRQTLRHHYGVEPGDAVTALATTLRAK